MICLGFYALIYLEFSIVLLLAFLIQTAFEHHVTVIDGADHVTHFDDHETDYVDDPREMGICNSNNLLFLKSRIFDIPLPSVARW